MTLRLFPLAVSGLLAVGGCGASSDFSPPAAAPLVAQQLPVAQPVKAVPDPAPGEAFGQRKIIFNGTLEVEVKDFGVAHQELTALMSRYQAYFAKSEVRGDSGQKRIGTFTIKVPAEHFQGLVDALAAMGNPLRNVTDSEDVTGEYVDVEARVKNLRAEEDVLNSLLRQAGSQLENVLRIREQIRQNREQIERAEARFQMLAKLTALSTIQLTLRDHDEYVAPTAVAVTPPPTFGERINTTFASSLGILRTMGEWLVLFLVAAAPWLPLIVVSGLLARRAWRPRSVGI